MEYLSSLMKILDKITNYDLFDFADEFLKFVPVFRPNPTVTCLFGNPLTNLLVNGTGAACFFEFCSLALIKVSKILLDLLLLALLIDSENELCFEIDGDWLCVLGFGEGDLEVGRSLEMALPDDDVLLSITFWFLCNSSFSILFVFELSIFFENSKQFARGFFISAQKK